MSKIEETKETDLFSSVPQDEEVVAMVRVVSAKLASLPKPCSLCELQLSQGDVDFILAWASHVKASKIDQWLTLSEIHPRYRCSPQQALGLMFLLLACEVGRREAREGALWSVIEPHFQLAGERLFAQGQPRQDVKRAIQAAAEHFQLHHTIDVEGSQAYYTTVFLQFGFTYHGLAHLRLWLDVPQTRPIAVERLLKASPTFAHLWVELSKGRRPSSPYLLDEWQLDLEKSRPQAWLDWPGFEEPHFRLDLLEVFPGLADGDYEVSCQDSQEWLCVDENGYQPRWMAVDAPSSSVRLALGDELEVEVSLFEEEAYTMEGRPTPLRANRPLLLVLPATIQPQPAASRWQNLGSSGYRAHAFPEGLQADHEFFENGQLVRRLQEEAPLMSMPELSMKVNDRLLCWLPERLPAWLEGLPEDVEIRSIHHGGEAVPVTSPLQFNLPCSLADNTLVLKLHLQRQGRNFQRTVRAKLPMEVATRWSAGEWRRFEYLDELDCREAARGSFRFLLDHDKWGLVEGDLFLNRPQPGTRALGRLGGYGAPLKLVYGPYGVHDQLPRTLARSVVDRGVPGDENDDRIEWQGCRAVVRRGERVGADWSGWTCPQDAHQVAPMVRWFHLPLLQEGWLEQLQPLLWQQPLSTLRAWLVEREFSLGDKLLRHNESDAWYSVVDAYFGSWRPTEWDPSIPLETVLRASVRLAFRVVRDFGVAHQPAPARVLLQLAADRMGVAPEYLLVLARAFTTPEERWPEDLRIALRHHRFQDYLLAQLLEIHRGKA